MKNYFLNNRFLACAFFFIILNSCNKNSSISENRIIGKWQLTEWYNDTPIDINNDGKKSTDLYAQWNGCYKHSTLILNSNFTTNIVYTGKNNNLKCPPGLVSGDIFSIQNWKLSEDNDLTFIGDDYLDSYEIIKLTSNVLILKGSGFLTCCDADISYYTGGYLKFKKE